MRKWLKGAPKGAPAPPEKIDDTLELVDEFEAEGVLRVPSPDGEGTYTFVAGKENIKGYPMSMYWDGEKHGTTVHYRYGPPHDPHPVYGGEVAYWFRAREGYRIEESNDQRALVSVILQFIRVGKKIYANQCGSVMSVDEGL